MPDQSDATTEQQAELPSITAIAFEMGRRFGALEAKVDILLGRFGAHPNQASETTNQKEGSC